MDAFNLAMDYIAWHNFGNEYFVLIGRDLGFFLIGYLSCFTINAFVEVFRREKKMTKEHEKFIKEMQNIADSEIRESDAAIAKEKGRIQGISFMMETMEEYFKKSEPNVVHHIKAQEPKKKVIIIDNGKIKALRDAGWSYEKIADEVGCSPQTVANRLYAMTQKEKAEEKAEDK